MELSLGIIKNDVMSELRASRYYNEQEISRLVQSTDINHKDRVALIVQAVKDNVAILEAIKLMDIYFPSAPQQPAVQPAATITDQES